MSLSRTRSYLAVCLGGLLVGCADRMVTLRYQPDSRIQPMSAARQLTIFKFTDRRGSEGDEADPLRVGGVYGGYGNRLAKVMTGTPFQRTLNEALVVGFKARGVAATGIPDHEFAFGGFLETPLALGGELRNFSTESRWSNSAHISGILRLYDRRGAVLVEKRVSARDQGGLGTGVFAGSEPLEEMMNEALREFVQVVVMDPDLAAQLGAAPEGLMGASPGATLGRVTTDQKGPLGVASAPKSAEHVPGPPPPPPPFSLERQLDQLDELKAKGRITEDEHAALRRRVIETAPLDPVTVPMTASSSPVVDAKPASPPLAGRWRTEGSTGRLEITETTIGQVSWEYETTSGGYSYRMRGTGSLDGDRLELTGIYTAGDGYSVNKRFTLSLRRDGPLLVGTYTGSLNRPGPLRFLKAP